MKSQELFFTALLVAGLSCVAQAQGGHPPFPPPPSVGGAETEVGEGAGCVDADCEEPEDGTEAEFLNPLDGLVLTVDALAEFTATNCNSQKDLAKFQGLLKAVKDVVVKMRKLPGMEDNALVSELFDALKALKSDLKQLCIDEEMIEEED